MAPVHPELQQAEQHIKDVIQDLFQLMVQVSNYDSAGRPSKEVLASEVQTLDQSFQKVYRSAARLGPSPTTGPAPSSSAPAAHNADAPTSPSSPSNPNGGGGGGAGQQQQQQQQKSFSPSIPIELITYVEHGRNPDIYTREFVEGVRRQNQLVRGKMAAFSAFRDVLARQMDAVMPELRDDVARIVEATGGYGSVSLGEGESGGVGVGGGGASTTTAAADSNGGPSGGERDVATAATAIVMIPHLSTRPRLKLQRNDGEEKGEKKKKRKKRKKTQRLQARAT